MISNRSNLSSVLKTKGFSLTRARQAVFDALESHQQPSMSELIRVLPNIDRASVYRTVSLFEQLGIINRLVSGWKYKLELSDLFNDHHHHITCQNCGQVESVESGSLENDIARLGQSKGFTVSTHSLEIRGTCSTCQS